MGLCLCMTILMFSGCMNVAYTPGVTTDGTDVNITFAFAVESNTTVSNADVVSIEVTNTFVLYSTDEEELEYDSSNPPSNYQVNEILNFYGESGEELAVINDSDYVFSETASLSSVPISPADVYDEFSEDGALTSNDYTVSLSDIEPDVVYYYRVGGNTTEQESGDNVPDYITYYSAHGRFIVRSINASCTGNGQITPAGESYVLDGEDMTYAITPDAGGSILDVIVDGQSVGVVESYTFEDVTEGHTIEVQFSEENLKGDLNGDGQVNMLDVVYLWKVILRKVHVGDVMEFDLNGDGRVNYKDVLWFAEFLEENYPQSRGEGVLRRQRRWCDQLLGLHYDTARLHQLVLQRGVGLKD